MEKQNSVLREANEVVKKEERKERRRRRFVKARNAVAIVSLAAVITATEAALVNQLPRQNSEPSCYSLKTECPWPLSTPTHTQVPEHEAVPSVNQSVR